jgi:hypothetical protein
MRLGAPPSLLRWRQRSTQTGWSAALTVPRGFNGSFAEVTQAAGEVQGSSSNAAEKAWAHQQNCRM